MIPAIRHEVVGPVDAQHRIRIAHLSDLHLWFTDRKLQQIEQGLDGWNPDVLALTGDYADTPTGRRLVIDWIGKIAAKYPVCWVAGNHDRWRGDFFLQKLQAIPLAHPIDQRDAWITMKPGGRYRFTSLERAMTEGASPANPAPTIVLLHNPAGIDPEKFRGTRNCLLLAGHLHGGQLNLWRDRQGRPQPAASLYRWLVERTTIGTTTLIVSRGLGDTLPLRLGAPEEIVMVDFWV